MTEFRKSNWEKLEFRLRKAVLATRFAAKDVIQEARYRSVVSLKEHARADVMAQAFGSEAMDFIRENPTGILKPVYPTHEQMQVFYNLFENIDQGRLILEKITGRIGVSTNKPYIVHEYVADKPESKNVRLTTKWGVQDDFALGFSVFRKAQAISISFLILPGKAENSHKVGQIIGKGFKKKGISVGVFENGERIVFNREGVHKGKELAITDQFYLLGVFDGETTQKTYWVYGNNSVKHSRVSRSRIGAEDTKVAFEF